MSKLTTIRLLIIALLVGILSIRRDGFFPFPGNLEPHLWAWLLVLQVVILFFLLYLFFRPQAVVQPLRKFNSAILSLTKDERESSARRRIKSGVTMTAIVVSLLTISILALHYSASHTFPDYFHFGITQAIVFAIITIPLLVIPLILRKPKLALVGLFAATFILLLIPILYYQISANTSDLLPIILKQLEALAHGQNIYQYFLLDNGVLTQAVRQPGTTLSFWPAFALGFDIRWMSIIFSLLTGFVLLKFAYPRLREIKFDKKFLFTYVAISLFLLLPYRHARHDLYEPAYWFLLSASLYLLYIQRKWLFAVVWGLGIFTQVWFWLFTPFVAVYLWRKYSFMQAVKIMLPAVIIGAGLLSIFILPDPHAYVQQAFGFYAGEIAKAAYAASTIHLTPLVEVYGFANLLLPIQLLATALVGLLALWKLKTWKSLLAFLCLSFVVFVQFNSVSWNYMYIGLVLLLIIYLLSEITSALRQAQGDTE